MGSELRNNSSYGSYAVAASITLLAGAIFYFSVQLAAVGKVADSLALYRDVAPDIVKEVSLIREQIPRVLDQVDGIQAQLPKILDEVEAVRKEIPPILAEVKALRQNTVPALLAETEMLQKTTVPAILAESKMLRSDTIPAVLSETKQLRKNTIPAVLAESQQLRDSTIPAVLLEVKTTREALPGLIEQSESVIKTAGSNAVSGIFTGIITAPFSLMSNVSTSIFSSGLAKTDHDIIAKAAQSVLATNRLDAHKAWRNKKTGAHGEVTLIAMSVDGDSRCRELRFSAANTKKSLGKKDLYMCLDENNQWQYKGAE